MGRKILIPICAIIIGSCALGLGALIADSIFDAKCVYDGLFGIEGAITQINEYIHRPSSMRFFKSKVITARRLDLAYEKILSSNPPLYCCSSRYGDCPVYSIQEQDLTVILWGYWGGVNSNSQIDRFPFKKRMSIISHERGGHSVNLNWNEDGLLDIRCRDKAHDDETVCDECYKGIVKMLNATTSWYWYLGMSRINFQKLKDRYICNMIKTSRKLRRSCEIDWILRSCSLVEQKRTCPILMIDDFSAFSRIIRRPKRENWHSYIIQDFFKSKHE